MIVKNVSLQNIWSIKNTFSSVVLLIVLLVFVTFSCVSVKPIYYEDDKKIADNYVKEFHNLYNNRDYKKIYEMFSDKIKKQQSKEQFIFALEKQQNEKGKVVKSEIIKSEIKPLASYRLVHSFYKTTYEKAVKYEEFDCLVDGENTLFDYYGQPEQIE
jgi:hypothetical protein